MRLRREASLGLGAMLTLQILLSLLAIVVLTRMGPAIERILDENVFSGEAVEEMLGIVAMSEAGAPPEAFEAALKRAELNVTEDAERPLLEAIRQHRADAFAGDWSARQALVKALRRLGEVNRDSMGRADEGAKRLGLAGAWAAALLGALALALSLVVYRRLRRRIEFPVEEIRRTGQAVRAGNLQARCPTADGPHEIRQVARDLNWLLDQWIQADARRERVDGEQRDAEVRRVLQWVLDKEATPMAVFDAHGERVTANRAGLLVDVPIAAKDDGLWRAEDIEGTSLRLATYTPDSPVDPAVEASGPESPPQ